MSELDLLNRVEDVIRRAGCKIVKRRDQPPEAFDIAYIDKEGLKVAAEVALSSGPKKVQQLEDADVRPCRRFGAGNGRAFALVPRDKSGSKLHALHTFRDVLSIGIQGNSNHLKPFKAK